jgi:hypothetical protein
LLIAVGSTASFSVPGLHQLNREGTIRLVSLGFYGLPLCRRLVRQAILWQLVIERIVHWVGAAVSLGQMCMALYLQFVR